MFPYLYSGNFHGLYFRVPTYGVMMALAFSVAYFTTLYRTMRAGENPRHIGNLFILILVSSTVGGRLFHVFFENFTFYSAHPSQVFALWGGGLSELGGSGYTFYGSLLSAIATVYFYTRWSSVNFLDFGDLVAPVVALGVAFGRVGCFCAGCCWGRPTTSFLGVIYKNSDTFSQIKNVAVHPVQLYGASLAFLGFLYLLWLSRHRKYPGELMVHGLILYSGLRFIVEYFRGDEYRGYLFGGALSYSQAISLVVFPAALIAAKSLRKRAAKKTTRSERHLRAS